MTLALDLAETTARAADEALRKKADELDALARGMDDKTQDSKGYHPNSLAWFAQTAPQLKSDAAALRSLGREMLKAALR